MKPLNQNVKSAHKNTALSKGTTFYSKLTKKRKSVINEAKNSVIKHNNNKNVSLYLILNSQIIRGTSTNTKNQE